MPQKNVKEMRIDEIEAGLDTPNRVYLIDEADWVLDEHMVLFKGQADNTKMFGMQSINLKCHKIIMLSATWKPFKV